MSLGSFVSGAVSSVGSAVSGAVGSVGDVAGSVGGFTGRIAGSVGGFAGGALRAPGSALRWASGVKVGGVNVGRIGTFLVAPVTAGVVLPGSLVTGQKDVTAQVVKDVGAHVAIGAAGGGAVVAGLGAAGVVAAVARPLAGAVAARSATTPKQTDDTPASGAVPATVAAGAPAAPITFRQWLALLILGAKRSTP